MWLFTSPCCTPKLFFSLELLTVYVLQAELKEFSAQYYQIQKQGKEE